MSDPTWPPARSDAGPTPPPEDLSTLSPAMQRFKTCRWRRPPDEGAECCVHRDVLPLAGTSFNAEAWCPDCTFFKLRRTPKKRTYDDNRY